MHARLDHDRVKLLTRTVLDWTLKYPAVRVPLRPSRDQRSWTEIYRGVRPDGTTSFPSHWRPLDLVGPYASLTFQKSGATNRSTPCTFVRNAVGWDHSPHGT